MRQLSRLGSVCVLGALVATPVVAQDSVSLTGCLPGDAVSPYADSSAFNGSEQCNRYTVDLVPITTSWGNRFGLAPMTKASKVSSLFENNQTSAMAISRTQAKNIDDSANMYDTWSTAGEGVNNDQSINQQPATVSGSDCTNRFAASFAEFGTTDLGASYEGIVTSIVHYDPLDPDTIYVNRVIAAINGATDSSQSSAFGFGAVTNDGSAAFRADDFGLAGPNPITGQNIYIANASARDCDILNPITGLNVFDATSHVVVSSGTTHNTPSMALVGGVPFYTGTNFASSYLWGATSGTLGTSSAHRAAGVPDQRGGLSNLQANHPAFPAAVNGLAATLGQSAAGNTDTLNVFGLSATGAPVNALALVPPPIVTDPITGDTNLPGVGGVNEFDHYHSQVAFRGGNGQIAMNLDQAGNLLVTAVMDHPLDGGADWNQHFLPVAKVTPAGAVSWTNAAWTSSPTSPAMGKAILDGPGGATIGHLTTFDMVTGGVPFGPSFSSPSIDSAGNIWFYAAIDMTTSGGTLGVGLLRAVYVPAVFGYELELVLRTGTSAMSIPSQGGSPVSLPGVVTGANSATDYIFTFLPLTDSNSISSGTFWSQNVSEQGFNGQRFRHLPPSNPLHLGGLVFPASMVYDVNGDGNFDTDCVTAGTTDESYAIQFYLAPIDERCQLDLENGGPGELTLSICGTGLNTGQSSEFALTGAEPLAGGALLISLPGFANTVLFPLANPGTIVSGAGLAGALPIATDALGELRFPVPGLATPSDLVFQVLTVDTRVLPHGVAFSNAVLTKFGQ